MPSKQAVVIDMGGTTSDIAIVKGGIPKEDREASGGRWQTFVRGIAIDTFALGGDSQVGYKDKELFLCPRRVWPVTELAGCYPGVLPELEKQLKDYCMRREASAR